MQSKELWAVALERVLCSVMLLASCHKLSWIKAYCLRHQDLPYLFDERSFFQLFAVCDVWLMFDPFALLTPPWSFPPPSPLSSLDLLPHGLLPCLWRPVSLSPVCCWVCTNSLFLEWIGEWCACSMYVCTGTNLGNHVLITHPFISNPRYWIQSSCPPHQGSSLRHRSCYPSCCQRLLCPWPRLSLWCSRALYWCSHHEDSSWQASWNLCYQH